MTALMLFIATIASMMAGVLNGIRARKDPSLFWTYLTIGLIFTTPIAIGGYTWYDEIYVGAFLLSNLPSRIVVKLKFSHVLFVLFILYMLFQATRGVLYFADHGFFDAVAKMRWFVFFMIILFVFIKGASKQILNAFDKDIAYKITKAGLLFNSIYLVFGLLAILFTGTTSSTQFAQLAAVNTLATTPLAIFGSTAYVACTLMVIIPFTLIALNNSPRNATVGWVGLFVALTSQMLFQSRSGVLFILISIIFFFLSTSRGFQLIKRLTYLFTLLIFAIGFQIVFNETSVTDIYVDLMNTIGLGESYEDHPLKDIDRKIWNVSALVALSDNAYNFFLGWGLRTSGYIVAPIVYELFLGIRGAAIFHVDVATPGFAGLAVDTGLIGLALTFLLMATSLRSMHLQARKLELHLLFAPIAFLMMLFVINIFDVMMLYLALMPAGIYQVMMVANQSK